MMEPTTTDAVNYTAVTGGRDRANFEAHLAINIWIYGSPVLIAIGTVGNLLSAMVMLRRNLRKCTTSLYLLVLAVVDTTVLYTGLLDDWTRMLFGVAIFHASTAACHVYFFVHYLAFDIEAWILVCVGVERMVAVFWPHKAKQVFIRAFAARQMTIIGVILAGINSHFHWTFQFVDGYCGYHQRYERFIIHIFPWIDLCLASLIPFLLMLVANSAIATKLIHANRVRKSKLNVGNDKKLTSMTVILFLITGIFVLTTAPITVFNIVEDDRIQYPLLWASLSFLFYTNFAINFLLYCVSGPRFRRELFQMCRRNASGTRIVAEIDEIEAEVNTRI